MGIGFACPQSALSLKKSEGKFFRVSARKCGPWCDRAGVQITPGGHSRTGSGDGAADPTVKGVHLVEVLTLATSSRQAVEVVLKNRKASISLVQRHLKIGYNRAARLVEDMEKAGLVSSMSTSGQRDILVPPRAD